MAHPYLSLLQRSDNKPRRANGGGSFAPVTWDVLLGGANVPLREAVDGMVPCREKKDAEQRLAMLSEHQYDGNIARQARAGKPRPEALSPSTLALLKYERKPATSKTWVDLEIEAVHAERKADRKKQAEDGAALEAVFLASLKKRNTKKSGVTVVSSPEIGPSTECWRGDKKVSHHVKPLGTLTLTLSLILSRTLTLTHFKNHSQMPVFPLGHLTSQSIIYQSFESNILYRTPCTDHCTVLPVEIVISIRSRRCSHQSGRASSTSKHQIYN